MKLAVRLLGAACAAVLVLSACTGAGGNAAQKILSVTTLAQVLPQGLTVTGVALEYDQVLPKGQVPGDAFEVTTTLCLDAPAEPKCIFDDAPRTVVGGHTSSTKALGGQESAGTFVVLELDGDEHSAAAAQYDGTYSDYFALPQALTVTQVADWKLGRVAMAKGSGQRFQSSGAQRETVDDFAASEFAAQSGVTMPYRLYSPQAVAGQQYPLVITLHGHGESGLDNLSQIAGTQMAVAFAAGERQENQPAFVLSPQTAQGRPGGADGTGWWHPDWRAAVIELIDQTLAQHPEIDPSRIYLTGLSMGAYGSWQLLAEHPDVFAGAVLVCGEGEVDLALKHLQVMPIWVTHSEDDFVVPFDNPGAGQQIFEALAGAGVPVTWSQWAGDLPQDEQETLAQSTWAQAEAAGSNHILTKFSANTTPFLPHFSWVPTFENKVILDWLFSQSR